MRRLLCCVGLLLGILFSAPGPGEAQLAPADSAAVLLAAADELARGGDDGAADALYRFIVRRFPGTAAAGEAQARLGVARSQGTPGSGRVELQVWSTLYGLWLGVAVPGALGVDAPEPYGLGLLLGGPAGYMAGKRLAGSRELTEGQARAITLGGTWGTWQGFGWAEVLDLGVDEVCWDDAYGSYCFEDGDQTEEKFAAMVVGGVAGILVGSALSTRSVSPGVATTVNFGALWGSWFGFAAGYLADLEDDGLLAATLLGGNAGLVTTAVMAPRWNPSRSRARVVSLYGVMGGLSGLGLDLLTQPDDDKVAVGIPLATSIAGLALGVASTRNFDAPAGGWEEPGTAFLRRTDGRWSVGAPLPLPRLLDVDLPQATRPRAALGLTLVEARFR